MNHDVDFEKTGQLIKKLLYEYVGTKTFTNSVDERNVEAFFINHFKQIPYFSKNPEDFGLYKIKNDVYDRSVCWALLRGKGKRTVCMVHHYDTVGVEDFKNLKEIALRPDELQKALKLCSEMLSREARGDLLSGKYIFGKGVCDMKAGGAIQYALIEQYSQIKDFEGNILIVGVPDEENLSAGMRGAVKLMAEIKEKYELEYCLMVNSEPHQRAESEVGVISLGSVGKMLPFVYVRGALAHVGKAFEGLNPINVMSEIVRRTELNMELADLVGKENAPAPTWLYLKDSKTVYDVSMPLSTYGCLSVLNLTMTPKELLDKINRICMDSFTKVIEDMNRAYHMFLKNTGRKSEDLPWKPRVCNFAELYDEALRENGEVFAKAYIEKESELKKLLDKGEFELIECNLRLVDFIFDYVKDISPRVVYGLVPPYYPCVTNLEYEKENEEIAGIFDGIKDYALENFGQRYEREYFYTGISDLSYTNMQEPAGVRKALESSMPLFGEFYDLPLGEIKQISMPCINIGPWGKDFHKLTERVYEEDLVECTPKILDHVVKKILAR